MTVEIFTLQIYSSVLLTWQGVIPEGEGAYLHGAYNDGADVWWQRGTSLAEDAEGVAEDGESAAEHLVCTRRHHDGQTHDGTSGAKNRREWSSVLLPGLAVQKPLDLPQLRLQISIAPEPAERRPRLLSSSAG